MTTVAFRDGVMAADSLIYDEQVGKMRMQKIFRRKIKGKEHIFGLAGYVEAALAFIRWYGSDDKTLSDRFTRLDEAADFSVLIWNGKRLTIADRQMFPSEVHEDYYAIGSGSSYAVTAMDCGKNATQAVQMAIKRDINSGGRIVTVRL